MDLVLTRTLKHPDGIFSTLSALDGGVVCVAISHAYDDGAGGGEPKVPNGTYTCVRGTHQLEHGAPFETFEITGVEGHSGILFHIGN